MAGRAPEVDLLLKIFLKLVPTLRPEVAAALSACLIYALVAVDLVSAILADAGKGSEEPGSLVFIGALALAAAAGLLLPFVILVIGRAARAFETLYLFVIAIGLFVLCGATAGDHIMRSGAYETGSPARIFHLAVATLGFLELLVIAFGALAVADRADVRETYFGPGHADRRLLAITFGVAAATIAVHRLATPLDPVTIAFIAANAVLLSARFAARAPAA